MKFHFSFHLFPILFVVLLIYSQAAVSKTDPREPHTFKSGRVPEINLKQGNQSIANNGTTSLGNVDVLSSGGVITFTIENTGTGTLLLNGSPLIALSGDHPGDFFVNQAGLPSSIDEGGNATFTISFRPSAPGLRIAQISIENNDKDENPYVLHLEGNGVKLNQSILFNPLANKMLGDTAFDLNATSTSGLPVTYTSSNPDVASISGNKVTLKGAGTTIITASQAGNAQYNPAPNVQRTLTINAATGLEKISPHLVSLFPNPTVENCKMSLTGNFYNEIQVQIIDKQGKVIVDQQNRLQGNELDIETLSLPRGTYSIQINDGKRYVIKRLVKN